MSNIIPQITFEAFKIEAMRTDPTMLRALAGYHEVQLTMAYAQNYYEIGDAIQKCKDELTAEADRIDKIWSNP